MIAADAFRRLQGERMGRALVDLLAASPCRDVELLVAAPCAMWRCEGFLLDTSVLSELRRPRPEQMVVYFVSAQPLDGLFVITVTFAEIR